MMTAGVALCGLAVLAVPTTARAGRAAYVDEVLVEKSLRRLTLRGAGRDLKSYRIWLGKEPVGHKRYQGDNRTPEGVYRIDRRNPQSKYYLSLGIDYPRRRDREIARRHGRPPGGDIFIHGQPNGFRGTINADWTAGCVAVKNADMEELFRFIPLGCPILIVA